MHGVGLRLSSKVIDFNNNQSTEDIGGDEFHFGSCALSSTLSNNQRLVS